jgi:flagellar biosynthesis/type III secretory pathway protein FliH
MKEGREEGRKQGRKEARKEGSKEGRKQGSKEGRKLKKEIKEKQNKQPWLARAGKSDGVRRTMATGETQAPSKSAGSASR